MPDELKKKSKQINLPVDANSFTYFVDESGSKGSAGKFFVVAAVKTAHPDRLNRQIEQLRHEWQYRKDEFKFGEVSKKSLPIYKRLVEILVESDSKVGAFVVDKDVHDPLDGKETWEGHLWTTASLLKAMLTRTEISTILVDGISTPKEVAYGVELQEKINRTFRTKRVTSAVSLDSCTCSSLQIADLVASSIAHQRRRLKEIPFEQYISEKSIKAQLATYVSRALGLQDFSDVKNDTVNIRTINSTLVPVSDDGRGLSGAPLVRTA